MLIYPNKIVGYLHLGGDDQNVAGKISEVAEKISGLFGYTSGDEVVLVTTMTGGNRIVTEVLDTRSGEKSFESIIKIIRNSDKESF